MSFDLTDIAEVVADTKIRTRIRDVDGMRYLDPQQVFDTLPANVRETIDLEHFKAVLHTAHLLFVGIQIRQVSKNATEHGLLIDKVQR